MPQYTVHLVETVSTAVTVEAENPEKAIEMAYDSDDMPGSMTYGAFGGASVDECRDWVPQAVTDSDGDEVWSAEAENGSEVLAFLDWLINTVGPAGRSSMTIVQIVNRANAVRNQLCGAR